MKKKSTKILKKALCFAVILTMALTIFPLSGGESYAASFNADNPVRNLKATSANYNHIALTWSAFDGATGYLIYRAKSKDGKYMFQGKTDGLSFKCKGKMNKVYYFKVRAYKKSGDKVKRSHFSSIVSKKATLAKPVLSMKLYSSKVLVSWNKVNDATGYQVRRAKSSKGEYTALRKTKLTYFENKKVKKQKVYYYKVRAYKVIKGETYYGPYSKVMKGRTKIATPINVNMTATAEGLMINWHRWTNAKGYEVYRATSADGDYTRMSDVSSPTYTDKTIVKGTKYYYKVRAYVKLSGIRYYGDFCKPVMGYINDGSPIVKVKQTAYSVKLSWQGFSDITGYEVYRATSADGSYKKLGINTKSPTWENDELELDKIYYYKVRTYKKSGGKTKYGPYSFPVAGATKVKAPTSIKGSAQTSGIQLTWAASKNAIGYQIKRATSADGTYSYIGTATGTSYFDKSNLTKGKKYYYKIRGYMKLNGTTYYGVYSSTSATRDKVVSIAVDWLGCKESNGSHKKIIDLYNSNLAPGCGKMNYYAPWCATYVSAVGIKAKATDIIVRHSYCPTMLSTYKKKDQYSSKKSRTPKPGDIIFYDWNRNGSPDHVGMIVSCSGSTVKAIEGNKNDAVGYRTFSKGYTYIQAYGLPPYSSNDNGVKYADASDTMYAGTARTTKFGLPIFSRGSSVVYAESETEPIIAEDALEEAGIDATQPDGYSDIGDEYDVAEEKMSVGCGEETTELEKMKFMIKTLRKEADTSELEDCTESEYYAAFLYKLCMEAGIDACIYTEEDEHGEKYAWVEATLDGQLYQIDPSKKDCEPEKYTPEVTDCSDPDAAVADDSAEETE